MYRTMVSEVVMVVAMLVVMMMLAMVAKVAAAGRKTNGERTCSTRTEKKGSEGNA